jgi:hypothetical protein
MSNNDSISYYPFSAINQFMVNEYRNKVLQQVFSQFEQLPGYLKSGIGSSVKKTVQVPGFRNSNLAPSGLKARHSVNSFERNPMFCGQILQAWSELHADLRVKVFDLLDTRGWKLLPVTTDRTAIPGFMINWPKEENYELLNQAFDEKYSGHTESVDDIRLMVVWLSGILPVGMGEDDEEEEEGGEEQPQS